MESLESAAREYGFNPFELRDKRGRWRVGGAVDKLVNSSNTPGHGEHAARSRIARAEAPYTPGGAASGTGADTLLSGYGRKFNGKQASKIAQEYDKGKHDYHELPGPVKDYIALHGREIDRAPHSPITEAEHLATGKRLADLYETESGWKTKPQFDRMLHRMRVERGEKFPGHSGTTLGGKQIKQVGRRTMRETDTGTGAQTLAEAAAQAKKVRGIKTSRLLKEHQRREMSREL